MLKRSIAYRAEIDGLRALAVIFVLLYHAEISIHDHELFSGGFLGVDIFFVISGYLITKIIVKKLEKNNFSIVEFYERRIRRIVPALSIVLIVTTIFCWQILLPEAFIRYAESLVSSIAFSSNIFFYFQDSYNAEANSLTPLLHLWSLGVEEQFYIFYPLLLLALHKCRKYTFAIIILSILSLFLCELSSFSNQKFNFFMLPTRAWELFAGGIVAKYETRFRNKFKISATSTQYLLISALLCILISFFTFTDSSRLPSLFSVPLIISVSFIIIYGEKDTFALKILKLKPIVYTGLISYSLYLWHQPVFAIARYSLNRDFSNKEAAALIITSFILAIISYHFIETPVRFESFFSRNIVFSGAGISSAVFLFIELGIIATQGVPSRFSKLQLMLNDFDLLLKERKDDYRSLAQSNGVQINYSSGGGHET